MFFSPFWLIFCTNIREMATSLTPKLTSVRVGDTTPRKNKETRNIWSKKEKLDEKESKCSSKNLPDSDNDNSFNSIGSPSRETENIPVCSPGGSSRVRPRKNKRRKKTVLKELQPLKVINEALKLCQPCQPVFQEPSSPCSSSCSSSSSKGLKTLFQRSELLKELDFDVLTSFQDYLSTSDDRGSENYVENVDVDSYDTKGPVCSATSSNDDAETEILNSVSSFENYSSKEKDLEEEEDVSDLRAPVVHDFVEKSSQSSSSIHLYLIREKQRRRFNLIRPHLKTYFSLRVNISLAAAHIAEVAFAQSIITDRILEPYSYFLKIFKDMIPAEMNKQKFLTLQQTSAHDYPYLKSEIDPFTLSLRVGPELTFARPKNLDIKIKEEKIEGDRDLELNPDVKVEENEHHHLVHNETYKVLEEDEGDRHLDVNQFLQINLKEDEDSKDDHYHCEENDDNDATHMNPHDIEPLNYKPFIKIKVKKRSSPDLTHETHDHDEELFLPDINWMSKLDDLRAIVLCTYRKQKLTWLTNRFEDMLMKFNLNKEASNFIKTVLGFWSSDEDKFNLIMPAVKREMETGVLLNVESIDVCGVVLNFPKGMGVPNMRYVRQISLANLFDWASQGERCILNKSLFQFVEEGSTINWEEVSTSMVDVLGCSVPGDVVERAFHTLASPFIDLRPWLPDEENRLLELAKLHDDWDIIASQLNGDKIVKRTPMMCFYQHVHIEKKIKEESNGRQRKCSREFRLYLHLLMKEIFSNDLLSETIPENRCKSKNPKELANPAGHLRHFEIAEQKLLELGIKMDKEKLCKEYYRRVDVCVDERTVHENMKLKPIGFSMFEDAVLIGALGQAESENIESLKDAYSWVSDLFTPWRRTATVKKRLEVLIFHEQTSWDFEEDKILMSGYFMFGPKWKYISERYGLRRSVRSCRWRFKTMKKYLMDGYPLEEIPSREIIDRDRLNRLAGIWDILRRVELDVDEESLLSPYCLDPEDEFLAVPPDDDLFHMLLAMPKPGIKNALRGLRKIILNKLAKQEEQEKAMQMKENEKINRNKLDTNNVASIASALYLRGARLKPVERLLPTERGDFQIMLYKYFHDYQRNNQARKTKKRQGLPKLQKLLEIMPILGVYLANTEKMKKLKIQLPKSHQPHRGNPHHNKKSKSLTKLYRKIAAKMRWKNRKNEDLQQNTANPNNELPDEKIDIKYETF